MLKLGVLLGIVFSFVPVAPAAHRTKVQLWFDAEDYTWAKSDDAIRDIANLLTEEGVRGHFNMVGYLAQKLVERRRFDVIDALKPHLVGDQTLYHSRHPVLPELTDLVWYNNMRQIPYNAPRLLAGPRRLHPCRRVDVRTGVQGPLSFGPSPLAVLDFDIRIRK